MRARAALIAAVVGVASIAVAQERGGAWLGIALEQGERGAQVKQVVPDTPAEEAGLLAGDQILAVGDHATKTTDDLIRAVGGYRVGDQVTLEVARGDRTLELDATLGPRLDDREVAHKVLIDRRAPAFDLLVVAGSGSGKLADYAGKVVVLEFFSVTCKYCPLTHAALAKAQKQHGKDGFVAIGISADALQPLSNYLDPDFEPKERIIKTRFGDRRIRDPHYGPLGFTALHDATAAVKEAYWNHYNTTFPTVVVIDRDGYVRHFGRGAGLATDAAIARAVELLDEAK